MRTQYADVREGKLPPEDFIRRLGKSVSRSIDRSGANMTEMPQSTTADPVQKIDESAIPITVIRDEWNDTLRTLGRLNKTGPELLRHFQAVKIEGDLVYLGTENQELFQRLQYPIKIELVERALSVVHKVPLHIKPILPSADESVKIDQIVFVGQETGNKSVIPISAIREKWIDMLRALGRLNKTMPDLVQYFRVVNVVGNMVFLGSDNELYYERLQNEARIELVERALLATHKTVLKVRVVPVAAVNSDEDPILKLDRELGAEIKPPVSYDEDEETPPF